MPEFSRALKAPAIAVFLGLVLMSAGGAQDAPEKAPESEFRQIKLTEAHVKGFLSAQPELPAIVEKLDRVGDEPDPARQAELDAFAKKHGFADFSELDAVAANISMVMVGLDSQGKFTDPADALKKELEDVKADDSIPADDRKLLVEELTEAIATMPPLRHPENVDLVKAHRQEIEQTLE